MVQITGKRSKWVYFLWGTQYDRIVAQLRGSTEESGRVFCGLETPGVFEVDFFMSKKLKPQKLKKGTGKLAVAKPVEELS